jgi:hypothetical protein
MLLSLMNHSEFMSKSYKLNSLNLMHQLLQCAHLTNFISGFQQHNQRIQEHAHYGLLQYKC